MDKALKICLPMLAMILGGILGAYIKEPRPHQPILSFGQPEKIVDCASGPEDPEYPHNTAITYVRTEYNLYKLKGDDFCSLPIACYNQMQIQATAVAVIDAKTGGKLCAFNKCAPVISWEPR